MAPDYSAGAEVVAGFSETFDAAGGQLADTILPPLGTRRLRAVPDPSCRGTTRGRLRVLRGAEAVRYIATAYDTALDNPVNKLFVAGFRESFKRDPGAYFHYDAMILLDAALRSTKGDSSPEALASTLPGMTFDRVRGPLTIDATTHGITQTMYAVETVLEGDHVRNASVPNWGRSHRQNWWSSS